MFAPIRHNTHATFCWEKPRVLMPAEISPKHTYGSSPLPILKPYVDDTGPPVGSWCSMGAATPQKKNTQEPPEEPRWQPLSLALLAVKVLRLGSKCRFVMCRWRARWHAPFLCECAERLKQEARVNQQSYSSAVVLLTLLPVDPLRRSRMHRTTKTKGRRQTSPAERARASLKFKSKSEVWGVQRVQRHLRNKTAGKRSHSVWL